jgi:uncharacterized protein YbjT (DUF2867 family)
MVSTRDVLITGATGYMGTRLAARLMARGHNVNAVSRPASQKKLPLGCKVVPANVLDAATWKHAVQPGSTVVHLVGTPHPSPAKAKQFVEIDLRSVKEAIPAAVFGGAAHFIYVSVAHPAPAMHAYVAVRTECEQIIRNSGLNATILRPWYVLGPGHWWPVVLIPFYKLAEMVPATSASAGRLGLVTIENMLAALVHAVEHPAHGIEVVDVPGIRARR